MIIGKLDREVQLQSRLNTKDGYGQEVQDWQIEDVVWCQKIDVVRATTELDKVGPTEVTKYVSRFIIRYRADINGTWRLKFEGRIYEITQIAEIGRREGLEIVAVGTDSDFYQNA